ILVPTVKKFLPKDVIDRRYDYINNFENLLQENGTVILKFYLHISQEEQHERFEERLVKPEKRWKYSANDLKESKRWDDYMVVFEEIFERCSPDIPWHIIPGDQNWYRDFLVASEIVSALKKLNMKYPELDA
ncbi:MAG: polyphosphate kinase 2 family protein, partial [Bacteroidia bacterium]|nr:polyphosphate kinase 2 family protein [Bacteroidia bacterium]